MEHSRVALRAHEPALLRDSDDTEQSGTATDSRELRSAPKLKRNTGREAKSSASAREAPGGAHDRIAITFIHGSYQSKVSTQRLKYSHSRGLMGPRRCLPLVPPPRQMPSA